MALVIIMVEMISHFLGDWLSAVLVFIMSW